MWKEFKEFALKGSVMDMALGIIIGAAFAPIVKSLVDDVIMPPIGLLLGGVDFTNLFVVVREGSPGRPYASLEAAQAAGAVTVNYGVFANTIVKSGIAVASGGRRFGIAVAGALVAAMVVGLAIALVV